MKDRLTNVLARSCIVLSPPVAGLALSVALATGALADPPSWPAWHGPNRDAISPESGWVAEWPEAGPKVLWRTRVGVGFSSVSVVGDRVFTMGNIDNQDIVWCLDAKTGKDVWTHKYPCRKGSYPGTRMTPTVDGDLVYTLSRVGDLFALETKTGNVKWSKNVRDDFGVQKEPNNWGLACSPLVLGDLLLLDLGGVLALEKKTGELAWSTAERKPGFSSPVVFELAGKSYATSFNAWGLSIVDLKSRKEVASHEWKTMYQVNAATPIVEGDKVFISSGYNRGCGLLEFDGTSLEVVYDNKNMRNHCNNSVLYGGYLYGFDGQQGSTERLVCLDFATGAVKWAQAGMKVGSLMVADGKIVAMLDGGELLVAEATPKGYKELGRTKVLDDQCWTYPVLCGGRIYCRSNKGEELACVDVSGK